MALSKLHTLATVRGLLILWMKELNISTLDPDLVDDFINLSILDTFSALKDSIYKLYGRTANPIDTGECFKIDPVTGASFAHSTKTITKAAHGLTTSDIGKRILITWIEDLDNPDAPGGSFLGVSHITEIVDSSSFKIFHDVGEANYSSARYVVLSRFAENQLDLSGLKVNSVRKLWDSTNGEYVEVSDARDFENLSLYPQKRNKIYFYQNGEIIRLFKGSNVAAFGTISMDYFGIPEKPATESDYLDIPDEHIGLVIQNAQNYIISHLDKKGQSTPVENKQNRNKQSTINTNAQIEAKK